MLLALLTIGKKKMIKDWHTTLVAVLILAALAGKWWEAKAIDLSDWSNVISILAAIGFIAAKDSTNNGNNPK